MAPSPLRGKVGMGVVSMLHCNILPPPQPSPSKGRELSRSPASYVALACPVPLWKGRELRVLVFHLCSISQRGAAFRGDVNLPHRQVAVGFAVRMAFADNFPFTADWLLHGDGDFLFFGVFKH